MGSTDDAAQQPVIVLRVVIRSPDIDTFIAKYSRFVKDDRIFLFTKSSQPPATRVRFTLELADGQPLIHGEGTVARVSATRQTRPHSFGDELTGVQTQVRATNSSGGGVPVADIPMTRDFDE